ncbi:unnamed protein product [Phytomonas sp. Hart1]|nr:unnamed protein product [Phytomonas sp. Hart1]|eukprot:CCW67236.1 unnamed protein product [Phytomonas sp. isolate Hart1]
MLSNSVAKEVGGLDNDLMVFFSGRFGGTCAASASRFWHRKGLWDGAPAFSGKTPRIFMTFVEVVMFSGELFLVFGDVSLSPPMPSMGEFGLCVR